MESFEVFLEQYKKEKEKHTKPDKSEDERKDHFRQNEGDIEFPKEKLNERTSSTTKGDTQDNPVEDKTGKSIEPHKMSSKLNDHFSERHDELDDQHKKAIRLYKKSSHEFNEPLRKNSKNQHPETDDLKVVTNHKIPEEMHGYRSFGKDLSINKLKKGSIVKDNGFTGISRNISTAKKFEYARGIDDNGHYQSYIAKIHLPKGTKAHYLDNDSADHIHMDEQEILTHPGTSFKVTGHTVHKTRVPLGNGSMMDHHQHIIHMTVHHQED